MLFVSNIAWKEQIMDCKLKYKAIEFGNKTLLVLDKWGICLTVSTKNYKMWSESYLQTKIYQAIKRRPNFYEEKKYTINTAYIFVTESCNLQCKFCSMRSDQKGSKPQIAMTESLVEEKVIPLLKRIIPRKIIISGGEPLLHKNICSIIRKISTSLKTRIILQTNGTLLDEKFISSIAGVLDSIEISTSHYNNIYELESYIQLCKEKKINITFSYIYEGDLEKLYNIIDLAAKYDLGFILNFVAPTGSALDKDYNILKSEERLFVFRKLAEYILKKNYTDKLLIDIFRTPIIPSRPCGAYGRMFAIFPEGEMYLCHSLKYQDYYIGNISQESSMEIEEQWKNLLEKENIKNMFNLKNIPICTSCKFAPICGGICTGEKHNKREPDCTLRKVFWLYNILFYNEKNTSEENLKKFIKLTDTIDQFDTYIV